MTLSEIPMAPGRLPLLGNTLSMARGRLDYVQSLRAYGDIVSVQLGTTPFHVVNSPELIHQMLVRQSGKFSRGLIFDRARTYTGTSLIGADGDVHKRKRRIVQPAFDKGSIHRYLPVAERAVRTSLDAWRPGQVVAVEQEMHRIATEVVSRALFTTGEVDRLAALVRDSLPQFVAGLATRTFVPWGWVFRLPFPGNRRFDALAENLREAARTLIRHCRDTDPSAAGLVSAFFAAGAAMSEDEMVDEVIGLLMAGIETTATVLTWTFYELGRRPELRTRLQEEAGAVLGERSITGEDLARLPFTSALLTEALRLYAPAWLLMRRITEEVKLGDHVFPAGAQFIFSPTALHRDPALYPDPLRFDPDRWIDSPPPASARCLFIPFGAGPRKCMGESFAWNEMHVALTTIARHWELLPQPHHKPKVRVEGSLHLDHLPMTLRPHRGADAGARPTA